MTNIDDAWETLIYDDRPPVDNTKFVKLHDALGEEIGMAAPLSIQLWPIGVAESDLPPPEYYLVTMIKITSEEYHETFDDQEETSDD